MLVASNKGRRATVPTQGLLGCPDCDHWKWAGIPVDQAAKADGWMLDAVARRHIKAPLSAEAAQRFASLRNPDVYSILGKNDRKSSRCQSAEKHFTKGVARTFLLFRRSQCSWSLPITESGLPSAGFWASRSRS